MASDTSLVFNLVARDRVTRALNPIANRLQQFGTKITGAVAGIGVATPYVAAAAAAAGGLAAGAVAAGAAVGAFRAAVAPQLESVTSAWTLYDAAQQAAAQGGAKAKAAQQAYTQALAQMTPATRGTALAFIGLKKDFTAWSNGLSGTTMPIFTRGIQALRAALPALTPLVKAAAGAIGGFVDDIAKGAKSGGFKKWIADFATVAGPALKNFLTVVKNLAIDVGALLHAFLPMSAGMTGGLAKMSKAFATWAKGLEGSQGFARFVSLANSGKGALGNLATALVQLLQALAPFMGATTIIAQGLANVIGAIPPGVISVLAQAFIAASVGMKAWAIATTVWSGVQRIATAAQIAFNAAQAASPTTWIIVGIVALIAVIVLIATKTTWFQQIWHASWGAIKGAAAATWGWIKRNWPLILGILTGPIGLAVFYVTKKWNSVVSFFSRLPARIGRATAGMFNGITAAFRSAINTIIRGWNSLRFSIPSIDTHIPGVGKIGGSSVGVPKMPYLAKGGHIMAGGIAMVGERGPEQVYLPKGATVAPLPRGGAGGQVTVRFDFTGADDGFKRAIRKIVRVDGRGSVQVAFGTG